MITESRGTVITFFIQTAILVAGWMAASLITRHGFTWDDGQPNFGKTFLYHGLWFELVPLTWLILTTRMMRSGSRWTSVSLFICGPAIAIGIILVVVKAVIWGGLGGGGTIVGPMQ